MFRKVSRNDPAEHLQHPSQLTKSLAGVATLGAWFASWFGLFLPGPIPFETARPGYLERLTGDTNTDSRAEQDTSEQGVHLLLPDLRTLPPFDLRIVPLAGGWRELRLTNTIWNKGQCPLELSGIFNTASSQIRVHQQISTSDGSLVELLVGEFIWHPSHVHWHFEDFT